MTPSSARDFALDELLAVITRHWGFSTLRDLQEQAMRAVLGGRDSLVVMPTGGGKSLCYQAPAVYRGGTTVVVSPLIALMKDQVDGLRACGISAAQLDSSMASSERNNVERALARGKVNLLFVSPERLVQTDLYRTLASIGVKTFAIDEAHCISHWGHDFRPEYRMLSKLREHFPEVTVHAYTATATEKVRRDIITQLALIEPAVLVGNFDRSNLTYRVWPRHDAIRQVMEVVERHPGEAGIVYCMRRRDVDDLAAKLRERGVNALPYHAGMSNEDRKATQEAFASEQCDIVVATIAFGMGIDRSNVRFVIHTAMPKSIEHFQQETGRAGRDGLEAECVLLYSGGDVITMKAIIEKSAEEAEDRSFLPGVMKHLEDMDRYARGAVCRHKALVEYFGQSYEPPQPASCGACDLCLGDTEDVPDAQVVAQKILSCVARLKESFGIGQVVDVLRGKANEKVLKRGHEKLTVYGLLKDHTDNDLRDWIYQLIGQEALIQTEDEYPKLRLNAASWEIMKGQRSVRLVQLVRRKKGERPQKSQTAVDSWEGVDQELFEALRTLRRTLASERQVPSYVIFGDATLRELARIRPSTPEAMRQVYGIGEAKLREYGSTVLQLINEHCKDRNLSQDVRATSSPGRTRTLPGLVSPAEPTSLSPRQHQIYGHFRENRSIEEVMTLTGLARSTIVEYLVGYIRHDRLTSLEPWVDEETRQHVITAARQTNADKLKPIYIALGTKVSYDVIKLVLASLTGEMDDSAG